MNPNKRINNETYNEYKIRRKKMQIEEIRNNTGILLGIRKKQPGRLIVDVVTQGHYTKSPNEIARQKMNGSKIITEYPKH